MDIKKRDVLVVTATTGIGLLSNVISYSIKLPQAKGHKFGFAFPKGIELTYVLVTSFVAGVIVNKVLSSIEDSVKTKEEKLLEQAYADAVKKAKEGEVRDKNPMIQWA